MKETIKNLTAYQAELPADVVKEKYQLDHLARLSANESPYGPSPKVGEAIRAIPDDVLGFYPDGQATLLRDKVAALEQVDPENLVFGVGADELIQLLTRTVLTPGGNMVVPSPTFGEYAFHAQFEQATTKQVPVDDATGHVDFAGMLAAVDDRTEMVWLANPNNPTGVFETRADILAFLAQLPESVVLVVDEAYYDFVDAPDATLAGDVGNYPNLVVLRTLSKAYGVANLRVGYGIMTAPLYPVMQAVRLPYNLNTYQIVGGAAALDDQTYLQEIVKKVQHERTIFQDFLHEHGFKFYASQTNFIWLQVGDSKRVGEQLLSHGYQVNDRLSDSWLRIALGTPTDNAGMRDILAELQ